MFPSTRRVNSITHPRPGRDNGVVAVSTCRRDRTEARTPRQQISAVRLPFATLGAASAAALLPVERSAHLCCSFAIAVFAARHKNIPQHAPRIFRRTPQEYSAARPENISPHVPRTVFRGCAWEVAPRKYEACNQVKRGFSHISRAGSLFTTSKLDTRVPMLHQVWILRFPELFYPAPASYLDPSKMSLGTPGHRLNPQG